MAVQLPRVKRNDVQQTQSVGRANIDTSALTQVANQRIEIVKDAVTKGLDIYAKYTDEKAKTSATAKANNFELEAAQINAKFENIPKGVDPTPYLAETTKALKDLQQKYIDDPNNDSLTRSYLEQEIDKNVNNYSRKIIGINANKVTAYNDKVLSDKILSTTDKLTGAAIIGTTTEGKAEMQLHINDIVATATKPDNPNFGESKTVIAKSIENAILNNLATGNVEGAKALFEQADSQGLVDPIKSTTLSKIRQGEIKKQISDITIKMNKGSMSSSAARDWAEKNLKNPDDIAQAYSVIISAESRIEARNNRLQNKTYETYYNLINSQGIKMSESELYKDPRFSALESLSPAQQSRLVSESSPVSKSFKTNITDYQEMQRLIKNNEIGTMTDEAFEGLLSKYQPTHQRKLVDARESYKANSSGQVKPASIETIIERQVKAKMKGSFDSEAELNAWYISSGAEGLVDQAAKHYSTDKEIGVNLEKRNKAADNIVDQLKESLPQKGGWFTRDKDGKPLPNSLVPQSGTTSSAPTNTGSKKRADDRLDEI